MLSSGTRPPQLCQQPPLQRCQVPRSSLRRSSPTVHQSSFVQRPARPSIRGTIHMEQPTLPAPCVFPLPGYGQHDLPSRGNILQKEAVSSFKIGMKGIPSAKTEPLLCITLGYTARKDISMNNHDDNQDHPMDILPDMVCISTLIAPAPRVRGSKVRVSYVSPTCNHLVSLASWVGAACVCCLDIISPVGVSPDPLQQWSPSSVHGSSTRWCCCLW